MHGVARPLEHRGEEASQLLHRSLHFQSHESERRPVVEENDENHAARDVYQIHRLLLALMEEGAELGLAYQARELVVGAEVGGRQGGEGGRVEARLLADGSNELPRAIDEHRAAGIAVVQELLERSHDRSSSSCTTA